MARKFAVHWVLNVTPSLTVNVRAWAAMVTVAFIVTMITGTVMILPFVLSFQLRLQGGWVQA